MLKGVIEKERESKEMTTMQHDGSNALTVQFAHLFFCVSILCHLPSVLFFFFYRSLQLCAHLMMSENHKRRQKTHTQKAQPWLDGNGGKKKDRRSILSSFYFSSERYSALTKAE
jgi:hypothetical protein